MLKAALIFIVCTFAESHQEPIVVTDKGEVRGRLVVVQSSQGLRVNEFLGIPFAKAPVEALRFSRPVESDRWSGVYNATTKPNSCWQPIDTAFGDFVGSTMWNPNTNMSEDCLYLNVWAPEQSGGAKLPVMVWIYGGGFYSGSSALDVYDGRQMAVRGRVVVVSMNYRLGIFGFLHFPNSSEVPGNAGLWDQVEALRWVKMNIGAFGGDNESVTLFGESAGAASVAYHLVSPISRHLFHRAILQSASALSNWAFMTPENALLRNAAVFKSLDCGRTDKSVNNSADVLDCLRSQTAANLNEKQWFIAGVAQFPFLPTIDNLFLLEPPSVSMDYGRFSKCPIIIGVNRDEGGSYAAYLPEFKSSFQAREVSHSVDAAEMKRLIGNVFLSYPQWPKDPSDTDVDSIVCRYRNRDNLQNTAENVRGIIAAIGDSRFVCSVNSWAAYYATANASVYFFLFDHVSSAKYWGSWTGSMHGDEVDYVFGTPFRAPFYSDDDRSLSLHIINLWTTFARTGIPTDGKMTNWPLYTNSNMTYYELSLASLRTPKTGRGLRETYCSFLQYCLSSSTNSAASKPGNSTLCDCPDKHGNESERNKAPSLSSRASSAAIFFCCAAFAVVAFLKG